MVKEGRSIFEWKKNALTFIIINFLDMLVNVMYPCYAGWKAIYLNVSMVKVAVVQTDSSSLSMGDHLILPRYINSAKRIAVFTQFEFT